MNKKDYLDLVERIKEVLLSMPGHDSPMGSLAAQFHVASVYALVVVPRSEWAKRGVAQGVLDKTEAFLGRYGLQLGMDVPERDDAIQALAEKGAEKMQHSQSPHQEVKQS